MKVPLSASLLFILIVGMLIFTPIIKPVKSDVWIETIYIREDGSIEPLGAPVSTVDYVTYTLTDNIVCVDPDYSSVIIIERNNTVLDGAGYTLKGTGTYQGGIEFYNRSNIIIKNTELKEFYFGVGFMHSHNITVWGNNITNSYGGVIAIYSSFNSIIENNITNNGVDNGFGIWLLDSPKNNITGNYIVDNDRGIGIGSSNNLIYNNSFIDNIDHVYTSGTENNIWDDGYPSGGNFWSNYTGIDSYNGPYQNQSGSDGIWDHPYIIDENNRDNYPLVNPWTPTPTLEWNRTYGGDDFDTAFSIQKTTDGGYVIAGGTESFGAGQKDFWLVKIDVEGNMEWNRTFGGSASETAWDVIQTNDSGYVLTGYTTSFGCGGADFWLVKTNADGNHLWNRTYGGAQTDYAHSVVQTFDGGYTLAGSTRSFGTGTLDSWLVKTDADGNHLWNRTYAAFVGISGAEAFALVQTGDGGYALAGWAWSQSNGWDFWLVKTDSYGNHLWNRTYGGTDQDQVLSLVQTGDGGYALAGYTRSFGAGTEDFWLVKTDSYGNHLWNRTYGGIGGEAAFALIQTGDGGYAIVGTTSTFGAGTEDFWLVKTDSYGNHLWNRTYGGVGHDAAFSLQQTADGGYIAAGRTGSFGAGGYDAWVIKLAPPLFHKFETGDWVQTTTNLNVREGPGLNYAITGIMSTDSLGQIIDGPVDADGYVWWNVDYILGIEGWSAENWLEITSELSACGRPVLVSPLAISRTGDNLTAEFTIQNRGDMSITLDKLLVGGRFNWSTLSSGEYPDFQFESVTLAPDELYAYEGMMNLTEVGRYQFFIAYYIATPSEQEQRLLDQNNWNTCIDLAEGLTDQNRSLSMEKWPAIVISYPLTISPPSGPYYPGDLLVARFSIKNVGSVPVTLDTLTVGGRDADGLTVDFEWNVHVTIGPEGGINDEYTYIGTMYLPGKKIDYHFFCAYQVSGDSWNPCIDVGEGLTDADRVKNINVESEYPLGGIMIPEVDFPEGEGKVIPIYVPPIIDGSNIIREESGWETVETLVKIDTDWDWAAFWAGLAVSRAEVWDPLQDSYVPTPEGAALSLIAGGLRAFTGAQSVIHIGITIQRDSQWNYRAILQVSDPEVKSFYATYAAQGIYSIVPGMLPGTIQGAMSNGLADYFKLPAAKLFETYLMTYYIDEAHVNEEYNCYLSLSKGHRIELFPKIYQGDVLGIDRWKQNLIFFLTTYQEVVRLEGQAFVDFEKWRATGAETKLIQKAIAPIILVPESAISLEGGSPCEFRICDSQNRVTGLVNGEAFEEIPSSMYLTEANTIIVYDPADDLHFEVWGTGIGAFKLQIMRVNGSSVKDFTASNMPIVNQTLHQYFIDWAALSLGEDGVNVQVDSDGDSVFEYNFTSDNELSRIEYVAATTGHDLDVTGVTSSRNVVGEGYAVPVNVTIMNYGVYAETFNITFYANATLVASQVVTLGNASSMIITFTWNTNSLAKGNYTLSAVADQVPGEIYTADNTLIGGWVFVTIPGDADGDRDIDIFDIVLMAGVYGLEISDLGYSPNCDIDGDGDVDIFDIVAAAIHYGESW